MERCQLWLPLQMDDHDPDNDKTLNRGREGSTLDADFGAGAAEPTKVDYRRGYSFDGGDHLLVPHDGSIRFSIQVFSIFCTFGESVYNALDCLMAKGNAAATEWVLYFSSSQSLVFWGDGGNIAVAFNYASTFQGVHTAGFCRNSAGVGALYFDGVPVATQAGIGAISLSTTKDVSIGASEEGTLRHYAGNIYEAGLIVDEFGCEKFSQYHRQAMESFQQV